MNRFVRLVTLLAIALAASIGSGAPYSVRTTGARRPALRRRQSRSGLGSVLVGGPERRESSGRGYGGSGRVQAPDTFDMVEMSQLIDAAVASQPDGLVVSIPTPTRWATRSRPPSTPVSRSSR